MSRAKLLSFASGRTAGVLPYSICVAAVIALMTVALQSFHAAATDPVKTLRYE
jgi:hypothetical protein